MLSRRQALGLLSAGAVASTLAACTGGPGTDEPTEKATCVPRATLGRESSVGAAELVYDIDGQATDFSFDAGFFEQLQGWLTFFTKESGLADAGQSPDQIWTFGSWIDGGSDCDSWHDSGRAFDLSRLRTGETVQVSCRYDVWRDYTGSQLDFFRRRYWAVAASLHYHFAYVLTYLYNAQHDNHIHIDNGRSGSELSTFSSRSPVQVQAVQAICNHLWGQQLEITGKYDRATRRGSQDVLDGLEINGGLTDNDPEAWRGFLLGSLRKGFAD